MIKTQKDVKIGEQVTAEKKEVNEGNLKEKVILKKKKKNFIILMR